MAAGCSTLTRNAVTHGLDPEVRKCLKIGNIIKVRIIFCLSAFHAFRGSELCTDALCGRMAGITRRKHNN